MSDSYATMADIAESYPFQQRIAACAAQQGVDGDPQQWAYQRRFHLASSPGWAAKVDSWRASNPDGGDGWATDPAVITDGDILAAVQPIVLAG